MALEEKLPKLQAARQAGMISILLVEYDDIALAAPALIGEVAVPALRNRTADISDEVWLAKTCRDVPWKLLPIKIGNTWFPNFPDGLGRGIGIMRNSPAVAGPPVR